MERSCKICEKYKEHYIRDHLNGKGMQFFEIMQRDFSQNLKIPKKFLNNCKTELPDIVDLKGPNGKIWHVGVSKYNDTILLRYGWKEFVDFHHIQEGDVLIFKYDGNYCFEITIFDENRCNKVAINLFVEMDSEKKDNTENSLGIHNVKSRHEKIMCSTSSDFDDAMIHEQALSSSRKISNKHGNAASNCQGTVSNSRGKLSKKTNMKKNKSSKPRLNIGAQSQMHDTEQKCFGIHDIDKITHPNVFMSKKKHMATFEEKMLASQLVHAVKPKKPCIITLVHPSFDCYVMYVPTDFRRKYIPFDRCTIYLQVPGQKKRWSVDYSVSKSAGKFRYRTFVIDNGLEDGDACLFELVGHKNNILMTVRILRAATRMVD